jgi:ribosomal protein S18 acetylase RimI-like enzyme
MDVTIGELPPRRWPEAGAMAGRAFWNEEYNRVLSEDPVERFAIVQNLYLGMDGSTSNSRTLAAFAGDHVVGIACVDGAETCFFCTLNPTAPARTDPASQVLFGVNLAIKDLHVDLPSHAYIGPVAVEPALQGHGIGRRLVETAFATAAAARPPTVALDCDPRLVGFYESCGFRSIGLVTDPYGFDIVGLRRDPG